MISFDDFKKVEITVGKILSAEKVPETDKLLKLSVDFGSNTRPTLPSQSFVGQANYEQGTKVRTEDTPTPPQVGGVGANPSVHQSEPLPLGKGELEKKQERDVRQIISGIATHFPEPSVLVGKKCMFVTNLEPRVIRGLESNGMLFAVSTDDGKFSLLEPSGEISEGTRAK